MKNQKDTRPLSDQVRGIVFAFDRTDERTDRVREISSGVKGLESRCEAAEKRASEAEERLEQVGAYRDELQAALEQTRLEAKLLREVERAARECIDRRPLFGTWNAEIGSSIYKLEQAVKAIDEEQTNQ